MNSFFAFSKHFKAVRYDKARLHIFQFSFVKASTIKNIVLILKKGIIKKCNLNNINLKATSKTLLETFLARIFFAYLIRKQSL